MIPKFTERMLKGINNLSYEYLLSMRHQNYLQYFEEYIENNKGYFSEILTRFVESTQNPDSYYSKIPRYVKSLFRLSRIEYRMNTEQNKDGKIDMNQLYRLHTVHSRI